MKLKEFIEKFVCCNTIVRLWKPIKQGHELIEVNSKGFCMEWELVKSDYADYEVIGVTDIVISPCSEAVNIIVKA